MVHPISTAASFYPSSLTFASLSASPQNLIPPLSSPLYLPPPDPPDLSDPPPPPSPLYLPPPDPPDLSDPPHRNPNQENPSAISTENTKRWSSLFSVKPKNAGVYASPLLNLVFKDGKMYPSDKILEATTEQWKNHLVGFFLDQPLNFYAVANHLQRLWKPQGGFEVKSNGNVFLILLSNTEERNRVVQADPVVIQNKLFIIKPWELNIGSDASLIKSVPVWIKMRNIPLYAWTMFGISWLAMRVGKFLCMDKSTESMARLEFAKCMVEVNADVPLVHEFLVALPDGGEQMVYVQYQWKPEACTMCNCFGHTKADCKSKKDVSHETVEPKQKCSTAELNLSQSVRAEDDGRQHKGSVETRSGIHTRRNEVWRRITHRRNGYNTPILKNSQGKGENCGGANKRQKEKSANAKNSFGILGNIEEDCSERVVVQTDGRDESLEDGEIEMVNVLLTKAFGGGNASANGEQTQTTNLGDVNIGAAIANKSIHLQKASQVLSNEMQEASETVAGNTVLSNVEGGSNATSEDSITKRRNVSEQSCEAVAVFVNEQDACEDGGQTSSAVLINMDSNKCGNRGGNQQTHELMQNLDVIPSLNVNGENVKTMEVTQQQMETNRVNGEGSEINAALIHTITKDLQHINDKLQIELDGFESNSKQYHGTLKTMNYFKDFKERNKLNQLDNPRLLGVADLVKQMVASVNIRGQTTPSSKCNNPYAHIAAPAAYKERPPDPVFVTVAVNSNEKAKSNPHITTSRKKDMLRNLQENG